MSLSPGTRLGPYEILGPLGAGGMGEVHRARDTRLNRDVAIKLIPAVLAGHEQIRQRFEREAKAISSLNHPHICTLYDVGLASPAEGAPGQEQLHYLVMELLEGESLAKRLQRGPLPLPELLKIGQQIALALDAAHRQGIIHRDLKPGNIMLTRSGAKLLDFGLARTAAGDAPPVGGLSDPASLMPTAMPQQAGPLTAQGMILGTFQYMAPEQLEGAEADARTDIFALGALLYEMATGKRAFQGNSRTSLIAAIVSSQPAPISTVTSMTPAALDHVVRRCLEKDPDDRWQSARDVAASLHWIGESGSQAGIAAPLSPRRKIREKLAWGVAALMSIVAAATAVAYVSRPAASRRAFRANLDPPPGHALIPFDQFGLSLSPDGKTLAFVCAAGDGRRQIWLRSLSEMTARPVPETDGGWYPFWSPDGQSLGFFADGKLKAIDLRGGSPRVLAEAPSGRGGSWSRNGAILFAPNIASPILRVSSQGGKAEPVTTYDSKTEVTHRYPVFLPDGRHFLYMSRARGEGRNVGRLMLSSLDGGGSSVLVEDASNGLYVEPGYLIYGRSASLYAQRFDLKSLKVTGQPVPIVTDKTSYWEPKNFVPFAASDDGTLIYLPNAVRRTEMRWYDRQGRPLGTLGPSGFFITPRISPDGRKVAYVQGDSPQSPNDIWIRDLEFNRNFRLTQQSGLYALPTWAPDGDRIAFVCQAKGTQDFCVTSLSSGGETHLLYASGTWKTLGSWTPDGKALLFASQDPQTNEDILQFPATEKGEPTRIFSTPFVEDEPQVSPDGRRMAFVSDQTGRPEVYVRNLGGTPGQWQISPDGGWEPRWRSDGKELVYAGADGYVMAVPLQSDGTFRPGAPFRLFLLPEPSEKDTPILEDATRDGSRFLLSVPTTGRGSISFHAITDWPALLPGEGA